MVISTLRTATPDARRAMARGDRPSGRARPSRRGVWAGGLAIALLTTGCSESKLAQCNRLSQVVNSTVAEVQAVVQANSQPNDQAFSAVADRFEQGKAAVSAVDLSDAQLNDYKGQLLTLYDQIITAARKVSTALQQENFEAARAAHQEFLTAANQESPLVDEVNTYCQVSP
ncbi:hypothetical protein [Thermoleptolyngbya sp. M55_K2018_002]|uniref:hypothetical protein n=1 Tax=Thermoleptolyngbya sp. M55_K2018_002 TaxID=2747808 RepID=UPI001A0EC9C0|nr:hypothetical protein [Thermoleptolyngbya sp. M55_K2018_002]HIK39091.1 hypothetical protein [Thermoleptolyngbya sp. M55_K2018_002]